MLECIKLLNDLNNLIPYFPHEPNVTCVQEQETEKQWKKNDKILMYLYNFHEKFDRRNNNSEHHAVIFLNTHVFSFINFDDTKHYL